VVDYEGHLGTKFIKAPIVSFTQMIIDVLDNAYRANRENSKNQNDKKKISIRLESQIDLERKESKIILTVSDEGPGFPQWIIENLGTPFFSTHRQGSGLGLYHAYILCAALGGTLQIENLKAGGAKVSISFLAF